MKKEYANIICNFLVIIGVFIIFVANWKIGLGLMVFRLGNSKDLRKSLIK